MSTWFPRDAFSYSFSGPLSPKLGVLLLRFTIKTQPLALTAEFEHWLSEVLCQIGSCNLDAYAEASTGFHMSYCGPSSDNLSRLSLLKQIAQIPQNLLVARVKDVYWNMTLAQRLRRQSADGHKWPVIRCRPHAYAHRMVLGWAGRDVHTLILTLCTNACIV